MKTSTYIKAYLFTGTLLLSSLSFQIAKANNRTSIIYYHHRPLLIHLKPNAERWITFPERVQVDARSSELTRGMLHPIMRH